DADRCAEPVARAFRHRAGHGLADRAVLGDEFWVDAEEGTLDRIRVRDDPTEDYVARSWDRRQSLTEQAPCATFPRRDAEASRATQRQPHFGEILGTRGVDIAAHFLAQRSDTG